MTHSWRGVVASIVASVLFGVIFYLAAQSDASAETVFAWRSVLSGICYLPLFSLPQFRARFFRLCRRFRDTPVLWAVLACTTAIVGFQVWLFMWAPKHGHALDASLGYLLLPICIVVGSRVVLKDPVRRSQWWVVVLAAVAIVVKIVGGAPFSWVTAAICLLYAVYFVMRKRWKTHGDEGHMLEVAALFPLGVGIAVFGPSIFATSAEATIVLAIALCAALAMFLYMLAASTLPLPLFGLLGYVEPVLLVAVALALGESLKGLDLLAYGILAVALVVLAVTSFRTPKKVFPAGGL